MAKRSKKLSPEQQTQAIRHRGENVTETTAYIPQTPTAGGDTPTQFYYGYNWNWSMSAAKTPFDPSRDYNADLKPEEFKMEKGRPFVYLKGLERLAKERGVTSARTIRLEQLGTSGVLCTYEYVFQDGRTYQGSADATVKNCDGNFRLYLTAMAESRAKARALRTAFSITTCSVEEKSDMTLAEDPSLGPIGDEQIRLIKIKATEHNLGKAEILNLMEVPRQVKDMKELTREEGLEIINALNTMSKKTKRRTRTKKIAD